MKKQIVVLGLGRFGVSLARTISRMGHDVLAIDSDEQKVQSVSGQATHTAQANVTDEAALRDLGIGNFDIGVVAIGTDIQSSVLATILLKRLGVPFVIAKAHTDLHGEILKRIGADLVVYPEQQMGEKIAHGAILGNILEYMPVVPGYGIAKVEAGLDFIGQTLSDLGIGPKGKLGVATLLIQREKEVIVTPSLSETVRRGDILIVAGNDDRITDFLHRAKREGNGKDVTKPAVPHDS